MDCLRFVAEVATLGLLGAFGDGVAFSFDMVWVLDFAFVSFGRVGSSAY